jgi:hypothetical protein
VALPPLPSDNNANVFAQPYPVSMMKTNSLSNYGPFIVPVSVIEERSEK